MLESCKELLLSLARENVRFIVFGLHVYKLNRRRGCGKCGKRFALSKQLVGIRVVCGSNTVLVKMPRTSVTNEAS
jgi:hypothetical protein